MRFVHVQIPGNSKMTITVQSASVFYKTHVMKINPVFPSVAVEQINNIFQQLLVRFIHYTGYGYTNNFVTGINYNYGDDTSNDPVNCIDAGNVNYDKTRQNSCGRICVADKMFSASNQLQRIIFSAGGNTDFSYHIINHCSCCN